MRRIKLIRLRLSSRSFNLNRIRLLQDGAISLRRCAKNEGCFKLHPPKPLQTNTKIGLTLTCRASLVSNAKTVPCQNLFFPKSPMIAHPAVKLWARIKRSGRRVTNLGLWIPIKLLWLHIRSGISCLKD